jgi:hypothetical protein
MCVCVDIYIYIYIYIYCDAGVEVHKVSRDFTISIASAYRLSTNKFSLSDVNTDLPGLDRLLRKKEAKKIVAGNQRSSM